MSEMTQKIERHARAVTAAVRAAHAEQEVGRIVYGDELDRLVMSQIAAAAELVSCFEQGAGAELRRLKDWLGDSLPEDWESRHFERSVSESGATPRITPGVRR